MKLFSKYFNLCDHDTSMLWMDGRAICHSNTAMCGKGVVKGADLQCLLDHLSLIG